MRDFYFKVILPPVKYGLVLWGACCDSDLFHSIERLHCRASRIVFNIPKDMASRDALGYDQWPTLFLYYKLDIFKLFYKAHNDGLPELLPKTFILSAATVILYGKKTAYSYPDLRMVPTNTEVFLCGL